MTIRPFHRRVQRSPLRLRLLRSPASNSTTSTQDTVDYEIQTDISPADDERTQNSILPQGTNDHTSVADNLLLEQQQGSDDNSMDQISCHSDEACVAATESGEWYEIQRIIRCSHRKGKIFYLVQWKNTWVDQDDISDVALRRYFKARNKRRRH
jgi:hypothetical protein